MNRTRLFPVTVLLLLTTGCGSVPPPAGESDTSASSSGSESASGTELSASSDPGTTTTTTGADSGTDAGSTDTGTIFIEGTGGCGEAPGGAFWHCTFECDVRSPNECPDGEKCMPWANDGGNAWNATRCSPVDPEPAAAGDPCTAEGSAVSGIDDCALYSMCWGVDPDTLMGTCEAFCDAADASACADPQECVDLNEATFALCLTPCNPLDAEACPAGEECRLTSSGAPYCLPAQGGAVQGNSGICGESMCSEESLCVDPALIPECRSECCTPWCDLGDPDADATCAAAGAGLTCVPYYRRGAAPAGLEMLGACTAG